MCNMKLFTRSFLLASAALLCSAQQEPAAAKPAPVYKIDLVLRDTDGTTKPTLRRFTMLADEREFSRLRTGGRVPYTSGSGQFNYADVGTNITFRALDRGEQVKIEYEVELSDVGRVDPETKNPTISQHKTSGSSAIPFGKPTMISSWEDAATKRHYEIEVTATRVIR